MASTTVDRTVLEKRLAEELKAMVKGAGGVHPFTFKAPSAPEPAPVDEPEPPKPEFTHLPEGHKWASDVIGSKLEQDFPVRIFTDTDWDERIRAFIPEPKRGYIIQVEQAVDILQAWESGDKVLISGPTGAGKSSLVEHLCALVRRPFVRFNATGDMDSSMIFGQLTARDGSTIWVDGVVTEGVRYGAVIAWDEFDVTPPEISMGMQWLLEDDGKLFLKEMPGTAVDKFIIPHEHNRIVCLGNTLGAGDESGRHAGVNVQNSATIDRFGTCIKLGYLPVSHEVSMLTSVVNGFTKANANKLVKFAALVRQGYETGSLGYTMSPRALIAIAKKMTQWGMSARQASEKVYFNKLNASQRRAAEQLFDKVYGS